MKRSSKPPRYTRHSSGQARCRINGQAVYVGEYGSEASHAEYARILAEWQNEREGAPKALTIRALCCLYMRHCKTHYVKNGRQTSEVQTVRDALKRLIRTFGRLTASEFSPLKFKRLREGADR